MKPMANEVRGVGGSQGGGRVAARRARGQRGMTLILALGMLAVLMMVMLTLTIAARTERRAAAVNADMVRARMLAESAISRAVNFIETTASGDIYPGSGFYEPPAGNAWAGRQYLTSVNGSDTVGIGDALDFKLKGLDLTPNAQLHPAVGWVHSASVANFQNTQRDVILGRYAYAVIDNSGMIDPGAVVSDTVPEIGTVARTGASVEEISLSNLGLANADLFRPKVVQAGLAGLMPVGGKWYSLSHIVAAIHPDQATFQTIANNLSPYSSDVERFWRDSNNNNAWDQGEDADRIDLSGNLTLTALNDLFVGPDRGSGNDDCAWLRQVDNNPWVQAWRTQTAVTNVEARRRIAARLAVNILDYADADMIPTPAYVDQDGNIHSGVSDVAGTYSVFGVERTWGISEIAMRIQTTVLTTTPPPGTNSVYGRLGINPGNGSRVDFVMTLPDGTQYDRWTLQNNGNTWTYAGPAVYVKVKPQGNPSDRIVYINGQPRQLDTNTCYEFFCNNLQVYVYNIHSGGGNAMGQWYIDIQNATCTNITPVPDGGIPPPAPVVTGLRITPGFKGEIFYPFATNANSTDPAGPLNVTYSVQVATATGQNRTLEGTVTVAVPGAANVDGGTLGYSTAYTDGAVQEITNAFNVAADPPQNWYRIVNAKIRVATLGVSSGTGLLDSVPIAGGGSGGLYLCDWAQNGQSTIGTTYFGSLRATDALVNDAGKLSPDFGTYWTVAPDAVNLATADGADVGGVVGLSGYQSAPYCDANVKNAAFARIGELGRVHSYQPLRSLRLWSAAAADETGYDSSILDLFRIGADVQKRGKVNINTLQPAVLVVLLKDAVPGDATVAAQAILTKRTAGAKFTDVGQVFGVVSGLLGNNPVQDDVAETAVERLVELLTVRQNYFTVLVCAQAIKDVSGIRYDANRDGTPDTTAAYGTFDAITDSSGNVLKYIDRVLAEQKTLAVIYRDAFSNRTQVVWTEKVND